jgi:HD-GYP domain-containing protein (c-di-GMP phosphodiesterase class II)
MLTMARVDCPREVVTFDDFYRLTPLSHAQRHGVWRALQTRRWQALLDLLEAFQLRDQATWLHCQRVQHFALELGYKIKLNAAELHSLSLAALVHDIGKMAINASILNKEAYLDDEELSTIKLHSEIGERLVHPLIPHADVLAGIRHHHERMDGEGYPDRLVGFQIPLLARIISVADVFDALTQLRPYRRNQLTPLEALEILEVQTNGQLDPDLVCHFCEMIRSNAETVVEMPRLQ